ncbi:MAG: NADPH-dependent F420 reductase [Bacteroidetes bacterium]|nr:NADPH-dependent F420 reductase [Bacteroidota bacterium]
MTIGIIGSGRVGATLGKRWAQAGYTVLFGVRDPDAEKVRALLAEAGSNACTEHIEDIPRRTSAIVLATPHPALRAVIAQMGNLRSNILVDCTNPISPGLRLTVGHSSSGAEQLAGYVGGTPVVKAFNTMGFETMADPDFNGITASMFLCGDDDTANRTVANMAEDIGFDAVITGPLKHARYLEPMAMLWIEMAMGNEHGRDTAFRLLRRGQATGR